MAEQFTKTELQHMMAIMNCWWDYCPICASARKKLEEQIKSMPDDEPEFFSLE